MATELLRITTGDGHVLDAVLHNAERRGDLDAAVLHLHGKGGAFYTGPGRYVPESAEMASVPCVHLSINMRMHDLGFSRHSLGRPELTNTPPFPVSAGGGMWERISEGVLDVEAAVGWLRTEGFSKVFVSGKSSGGFFATQYASSDPELAGVVLMSPVHTHRMPFPTWFSSDADREETIEMARQMVAEGEGHMLIPLPEWYYGISAASLVERADEPADIWVDWMPELAQPLLLVYGDAEVDDVPVWDEGFARSPSPRKRLVVLPGADHSYLGAEPLVCAAVGEFVGGILAGADVATSDR